MNDDLVNAIAAARRLNARRKYDATPTLPEAEKVIADLQRLRESASSTDRIIVDQTLQHATDIRISLIARERANQQTTENPE